MPAPNDPSRETASGSSQAAVDVGVVCVHYHNTTDVARFLRSLDENPLPEGARRGVVVVDNGGGFTHAQAAAPLSREEDVLAPQPGVNLGYLNGCSHGVEAWMGSGRPSPTWWVVANTDVELAPGFFQRLLAGSWPDSVGALVPDVRERAAWPCNPFRRDRPSGAWVRRRRRIFSTPLLAGPYRLASRWKRRLSRPSPVPPTPCRVYAPHGSLVVLHRRFFDRGGTLRYDGFLYGEELHLAEQLRRHDLAAWWSPSLQARHDAQSVTRRVGSEQRRRWAYASLDAVYRAYFQPDAEQA